MFDKFLNSVDKVPKLLYYFLVFIIVSMVGIVLLSLYMMNKNVDPKPGEKFEIDSLILKLELQTMQNKEFQTVIHEGNLLDVNTKEVIFKDVEYIEAGFANIVDYELDEFYFETEHYCISDKHEEIIEKEKGGCN